MTETGITPSATARSRNPLDRLGTRLSLILAVALFPLVAVILIQWQSMLTATRERSEAALMGETLRTASGMTRTIQEARAQVRLIATEIEPVLDDPARCDAVMDRAAKVEPRASLIGFIPTSGTMTCAASGKEYDFSANDLFTRLTDSDTPRIAANTFGPVSKTSVMTISAPVRDAAGKRLGIVVMSLPHDRFVDLDREDDGGLPPPDDRPLALITFTPEGRILTSSTGTLDQAGRNFPADLDLKDLVHKQTMTFSAPSRGGEERAYSVVSLIPGQMFAIGSWPANALPSPGPFNALPPILTPLLLWVASVVIAYLGMQHLVIRHIRRISRALASFASGNRIVVDLDMSRAPVEIRELADSYDKMTSTILRDEAELENTIHQKEVLLREVHHRVKNNLQLISSIINLQMRRAQRTETRGILRGLQDRVLSMATVHRGLYAAGGVAEVEASALVHDIVRQLSREASTPDHAVNVALTVDSFELSPDQAVPLSLVLTEALTNAIKDASADTGDPQISVCLRHDPGHIARLTVRNSRAVKAPGLDPAPADMAGELGSQLVSAFVQQLGGTLEVQSPPGEKVLSVSFGLHSFDTPELQSFALRESG